jgi:hypothetical protein
MTFENSIPIKLRGKYRRKVDAGGFRAKPRTNVSRPMSLGESLWQQLRTKAPELYKYEVELQQSRIVRKVLRVPGYKGRSRWALVTSLGR